ncbi:uncharacterized protein EI90DRAFT_2066750 [Cantharellus anzutake]|uniref:uncharacterized protein n=1 Tax=Cantharellus anzutake TaxID=1750568 RepID=UPI001905BEE8|nr:uncharacterized protein EI90DRAFT_2066750 [Cantharellus anzutake]KAF8340460.1 hypothetical protein EI90DRAFT_2066750 [Cantharellus anzutake]
MTPSQEPTNAMTLADDFKKDAFHLEAESIPKESRLDTTPSSPGTSREPAVNSEVASETPIQDKAESNSPHQSEMPEPKVDPTPSSTDRLTVPRKTSASLRNASKPSTPAKTITTTPKPSPSTRATPSVAAVKLSSRPSATVTPFVQVQVLKPQPTGASVTATPPPTTRAAPPTTASNLRAKTPLVTTPRTSTSRPPLTAPTASSLAKARTAPVTGNETPKARTTAATKNPPSAMKPFAGKATAATPSAPKVPQTPARSVKASRHRTASAVLGQVFQGVDPLPRH